MIDISQGDQMAKALRILLGLPDDHRIARIIPVKVIVEVESDSVTQLSFGPVTFTNTQRYVVEMGQHT